MQLERLRADAPAPAGGNAQEVGGERVSRLDVKLLQEHFHTRKDERVATTIVFGDALDVRKLVTAAGSPSRHIARKHEDNPRR